MHKRKRSSRHREYDFFLTVILTSFLVAQTGCEGTASEDTVISWLREFSVVDDVGGIGGPPGDYGDPDEWLDRGRRIPGVVATLQHLLQTRRQDVELPTAAYALGRLGSECNVPVLIEATNSEDFRLRMWAAVALGTMKDDRAVNRLLTLLRDDDSDNVRANAAIALGSIGGQEAEHGLQRAQEDKDTFVAKEARRALEDLRASADRDSQVRDGPNQEQQ